MLDNLFLYFLQIVARQLQSQRVKLFGVYKNMDDVSLFSLVHVPSANMEETGFMTYTAASHQGVTNNRFGFTFGGMLSIFIYSLLFTPVSSLSAKLS